MKRQSIHFIVLFLCSNYTVRYQIIASKKNSPYHQKNFCFLLKPNSFLIDRISCQGTKNLASTRKKTKFLVVISLRMQVFPITTIRFKNPAKISRFVYSTHSPFNACADKCPLCYYCKHSFHLPENFLAKGILCVCQEKHFARKLKGRKHFARNFSRECKEIWSFRAINQFLNSFLTESCLLPVKYTLKVLISKFATI